MSRYENDKKRLKLLKLSNEQILNEEKKIKTRLKTALDEFINEKKTRISIKGVDSNYNSWVELMIKAATKSPILNNAETSSFKKKLASLKNISEKTKNMKESEKQKSLFNAYLNEIKSTKNLNVSKLKKEIESEYLNKSYKKRLITAINKRGSESRNIPYKIFNQIKNEQIKKYKKDGTPYPLNYFKSRYGYTNEQLKILNSEYVNKLDDMYNEIDSTIIKKLFIIERKYYEGKIKAILTLLRTRNQESYDKMNTSVKEDLSKGVASLKKEYGNKFISELRKRKPKEMAKLAKKIAVYARKYKQIYRAASVKIRRMEQQKPLSLARATRAKKTRI